MADVDKEVKQESLFREVWYNWQTVAAWVYLTIVMFDFLIMPLYMQISFDLTKQQVAHWIAEGGDKDYVIGVIDKIQQSAYTATTLGGGGLLHVCFGAILTGAVIKGKKEGILDVK